MRMECKNCGKMLDVRKELKFCAGCGAPVVEEKQAPKLVTRELLGKKSSIFTQHAVELEIRTRVFHMASPFAVLFLLIIFQITLPSFFIAFIAAAVCGIIIGILSVIIVSRSGPDFKNTVNEKLWFVPQGGPGRKFVESLSSVLPLMGQLPQDSDKLPDKGRKK
jgi:hypothetical protein